MATVLVIDDDRHVLGRYEAHVQARGTVGVFTAPTLTHAETILATERIDVVVLDYELPYGQVDDFIDRQFEQAPSLALVVISKKASSAHNADLQRRGVSRVFKKPCSIAYLFSELEGAGFLDGSWRRPCAATPKESMFFQDGEDEVEESDEGRKKKIAAGLAAAIFVLLLWALHALTK